MCGFSKFSALHNSYLDKLNKVVSSSATNVILFSLLRRKLRKLRNLFKQKPAFQSFKRSCSCDDFQALELQ